MSTSSGPATLGVVAERAKRLDLRHRRRTVASVSSPRLDSCLRSQSSNRTGSSRASTRSPRKERLRTRGGAPYLAVELVDPSGRIEGRVWSDVDLLDSRFAEGDAVRVLGRVDRFRDRLQLEIRSLEPAEGLIRPS